MRFTRKLGLPKSTRSPSGKILAPYRPIRSPLFLPPREPTTTLSNTDKHSPHFVVISFTQTTDSQPNWIGQWLLYEHRAPRGCYELLASPLPPRHDDSKAPRHLPQCLSEAPSPISPTTASPPRRRPRTFTAQAPNYRRQVLIKARSTFTPTPKTVQNGSEEGPLTAAVISGAPQELQARTVRSVTDTRI